VKERKRKRRLPVEACIERVLACGITAKIKPLAKGYVISTGQSSHALSAVLAQARNKSVGWRANRRGESWWRRLIRDGEISKARAMRKS